MAFAGEGVTFDLAGMGADSTPLSTLNRPVRRSRLAGLAAFRSRSGPVSLFQARSRAIAGGRLRFAVRGVLEAQGALYFRYSFSYG